MKKILTSLFALAAVFCASAEVPSVISVSPADGSTIENRENLIVTFTFSEAVKADSVQFASGPRFNRYMTDAALSMTAPSTTISVQVPATAWGEAVGDEYILTVTLTNMFYADGTPITIEDESETGEVTYLDYKAAASYTSPDTTAVGYLGVDPDPATTTAGIVYNDGWGIVDFAFSGEVELADPELCAYVEYTLPNNDVREYYLTSDDVWGDWNFWTGEYNVSMMLPYDEDVTESNLLKIAITLLSVYADGNEIDIPEVVYYNSINQNVQAAPKASSTAGIAVQNTMSDTCFDIYSLQGSIVKKYGTWEDVKGLYPGVYIINGRKVIVR